MKYLILSMMFLSGCTDLMPQQLKNAGEICFDKGGIHHISARDFLRSRVMCMNGHSEIIYNSELNE